METEFPLDVKLLIRAHGASMIIQRSWLRHSLYGHARKSEWSDLRLHLIDVGAWPLLVSYPLIRREWRSEPKSWWLVNRTDVTMILMEVYEGLWGKPSPKMSQLLE